MQIPKIDTRDRNDIIRHVRDIANSYTPNWRFNPDDADAGTALALLWTDMFSDTIGRLNKVPYKNMLAFYNALGAELGSAIPSEGFLTFELAADDANGGTIESGTSVFANDGDETLFYETQQGVFVTPAKLTDAYYTSPAEDKITHAFSVNDEKTSEFKLFNRNDENIQDHSFYLSRSDVFSISDDGVITIRFYGLNDNLLDHVARALSVPAEVDWEYLSDGEYISFSTVKYSDGAINLCLSEDRPIDTATAEDIKGTIRFRLKKTKGFENLFFEKIGLSSTNNNVLPTSVYTNDIQQTEYGFYPFGERFSAYTDLYISCSEALSKPNADIELSFDLRFDAFEIELHAEKDIDWKLIMNKKDVKADTSYRIRIADVNWEYFNGRGWASLPIKGIEHRKIFSAESTSSYLQHFSIRFECPEDIGNVLVNATEDRFIRIRILSVDNAFKTYGHYMTPWIEGITFSYDYSAPRYPEKLLWETNVESESLSGKECASARRVSLIKRMFDTSAMYFSFDMPPSGSPINILFIIGAVIEKEMPQLRWEYYNGNSWQELSCHDETDHFRKTGIFTFVGPKDFALRTLFGKTGYWLRIVDVFSKYEVNKNNKLIIPLISGIYENTVRIINVQMREDEYFSIEPVEADKTLHLQYPMIYTNQVWVNEHAEISEEDAAVLEKENKVEFKYDENGDVCETWVLWDCVDTFVLSEPRDRHYMLDKNRGTVGFSNGIQGKIPTHIYGEKSIRVSYGTTNNDSSNVPAYTINKFTGTNSFITRLYNPLPTIGGCDRETTKRAIQRTARSISHGGRAVSCADYEYLAAEVSGNIVKCKCYPNTKPDGQAQYGQLSLVVLQKDYQNGEDYFYELKKQITNYISKRQALTLDSGSFHIIAPRFISINVSLKIVVGDFNLVFHVQKEIEEKLALFLNPVSGNFNSTGWDIGVIPNMTQIANSIKNIAGLKTTSALTLAYFLNTDRGLVEVDLDRINTLKFILPVNGKHDIEVVVK